MSFYEKYETVPPTTLIVAYSPFNDALNPISIIDNEKFTETPFLTFPNAFVVV